MANRITPVNPLSVMALKVKENTFDLGSWLRHISIRDQVIRGRLLVRDLHDSGQLVEGDKVLVIGAGAAGLAATHALLAKGAQVLVVDKKSDPAKHDDPFSLWQGVTERFVGPYMYEWPTAFSADQRFPPDSSSVLSAWTQGATQGTTGLEFDQIAPVGADALRKKWIAEVAGWPAKWTGNLEILVNIDTTRMKQDIAVWRADVRKTRGKPTQQISITGTPWPTSSSGSVTRSFTPRLLFLAAGFGRETIEIRDQTGRHVLATGAPFWADDRLRLSRAGFSGSSPIRVAIFGGGDGALQDTLRALTCQETPLKLMEWIQKHHPTAVRHIHASLADLAAIERQHELGLVWESARPGPAGVFPYQAVFDACRKEAVAAAKSGALKTAMLASLRTDLDEVHLVIRETCFSKTYLLNRFLVLLLEECCSLALGPAASGASKPVTFKVRWSSELIGTSLTSRTPKTFDVMLSNTLPIRGVNLFVVRLGINEASVPGQYLGLTKRDTKNRRELAEVRLPFWVMQ